VSSALHGDATTRRATSTDASVITGETSRFQRSSSVVMSASSVAWR
jgi:hypothetical protein